MAWGQIDTITIDKSMFPNTDCTDFPVSIKKTNNAFKSVANGGYMQNASAYDLKVYSDSGLTTLLKYQRARHNLTTGEIIYFVKLPTGATATNTIIYFAFGDSSITTDQADPTNVWNAAFKLVAHLEDGSTLSGSDSTSNGANLTLLSTPTAVTGQNGGGAGMHTTGRMTVQNAVLDLTTFTYEILVKCNAAPNHIFERGETNNNVGCYLWYSSGNVRWCYGFNNGTSYVDHFYGASAPDTTNFHQYVVVMDNANDLIKLYIDGVEVDSESETTSPTTAGTQTLNLGTERYGANHSNVDLDELRVSNVARSADWIKATYYNLFTPDTYISHSFAAPASASKSLALLGVG